MSEEFAELAIDALGAHFATVEGVSSVLKRSLNPTDANGVLGLVCDSWTPLDYEMGGRGFMEPSLVQYMFGVEHLVKWATAAEGNKVHREVAKAVRLMLYRDPAVQVSLRQLSVDEGTSRERFQRFYVGEQRFASNEIQGAFVFLSATVLVIETEIV